MIWEGMMLCDNRRRSRADREGISAAICNSTRQSRTCVFLVQGVETIIYVNVEHLRYDGR